MRDAVVSLRPWNPTLSVIVPSYRRPDSLRGCLAGLAAQQAPADEVVVAIRSDDDTTAEVVAKHGEAAPGLHVVAADRPGVVAAMQTGLDSTRGEVVALIDDDAVARPDWTVRLRESFASGAGIAGVGGRDVLHVNGQTVEGSAAVVGRVQWWGRHIGNHHIGVGAPRSVDVLKGVNCAYRGDLLRIVGFDNRLLGAGAQVHWELALGLGLRRAGWTLLYDPAITVDHYPAQRFDADQRETFSFEARFHEAHNETLALLEYLGPTRRLAFAVWAVLAGSRAAPGLAQWMRFALRGRPTIHAHLAATLRGRIAGWRTWRTTRSSRIGLIPAPPRG